MSTLDTINSGDSGSESLGKINDNFTALNSDKIEGDSEDTLTNKTIDVDANTVTNVKPANVPTANKTGADTRFVTGTKGDTDELVMWDANGDAVSLGKKVTATAPSSSSDDTTVPTSSAVNDALQNVNTGSELFFYPAINSGASTSNAFDATIGQFSVADITSTQYVLFNFHIPDNFKTLTELVVIVIPDTTETIQYDVTCDYGSAGQGYNNHDGSITNETFSATATVIAELDVSEAFPFLSAGDYCGMFFESDTSNLRVIGLRLKYEI